MPSYVEAGFWMADSSGIGRRMNSVFARVGSNAMRHSVSLSLEGVTSMRHGLGRQAFLLGGCCRTLHILDGNHAVLVAKYSEGCGQSIAAS